MAQQTQALTKLSHSDFQSILTSRRDAIGALLPTGVDVNRMIRSTVSAAAKNPKILECSRQSIILAVYYLAYLGLEPATPLGLADLVPFKGTLTPIIGYRGLFDLAYRTGTIQRWSTSIVYDGDIIDIRKGTENVLIHKPGPKHNSLDEKDWVGAYAVVWLKGDPIPMWHYMSADEILAIKKNTPAVRNNAPTPWTSDNPVHRKAMWVKTPFRALMKMIPMNIHAATAIAVDESTEYSESTSAEIKNSLPADVMDKLMTLDAEIVSETKEEKLSKAATVAAAAQAAAGQAQEEPPEEPPAEEPPAEEQAKEYEPPKPEPTVVPKGHIPCPACGGVPLNQETGESCELCDGKGYVKQRPATGGRKAAPKEQKQEAAPQPADDGSEITQERKAAVRTWMKEHFGIETAKYKIFFKQATGKDNISLNAVYEDRDIFIAVENHIKSLGEQSAAE